MKAAGGLIHGRSTTDSVKTQWILSRPITSEVCAGIEKFVGLARVTSQQHHDCQDSRMKRDKLDVEKLKEYLINHSPFVEHPQIDVHKYRFSWYCYSELSPCLHFRQTWNGFHLWEEVL